MNLPLRVLCVCSTLDRGGAENMIMNLYRAIDKDVIQFDFVEHTQNKCAFEDEITSLGGKIFRAPRYHIYNILEYKRWWRKHFAEHEEHQIVHGHFFTISSIYFKIAHEFGRTTIGHSHIDHLNFIKRWLTKDVEKYSDFCFACSISAGKLLYPHKKYYVLKNAIDCSKFKFSENARDNIRNEFHLKDNLVIGAVGRFFPQKNPLGIIEIINEIYKKNNKVRLLWVGDGILRPQIEERIKEYKLQNIVLLMGIRSDVNKLLSAMDIYIMPSLYEGLPLSLIEAQASGLPCFCSDVISNEVNITGLCKFLPLKSIEKWIEAILVQDISRQENILLKIRRAGYDVDATAKWLRDFYVCIKK